SYLYLLFLFFFSSRRRHTCFSRDWSSDVCSSDLPPCVGSARPMMFHTIATPPEMIAVRVHHLRPSALSSVSWTRVASSFRAAARSEERRVGKECSAWRAQ